MAIPPGILELNPKHFGFFSSRVIDPQDKKRNKMDEPYWKPVKEVDVDDVFYMESASSEIDGLYKEFVEEMIYQVKLPLVRSKYYHMPFKIDPEEVETRTVHHLSTLNRKIDLTKIVIPKSIPMPLSMPYHYTKFPKIGYLSYLKKYVPEPGTCGLQVFETVDMMDLPLRRYQNPYGIPRRPRRLHKKRPKCVAALPMETWLCLFDTRLERFRFGRHIDPVNFARIQLRDVDFKPQMYLYGCADYMNHFVLKLSLARLRMNKDDKLSHVYMKDYLENLPRRAVATEMRRMFLCPSRSLSHSDIIDLVKYAMHIDQYINQMHLLMAVDSLRSLDCTNMEKESLMFSNSMRYRYKEYDHQPFNQVGMVDISLSLRHGIFQRGSKAMLIIAYFNLLLGNFKRAKDLAENLFQLDFNLIAHGEQHLQWTVLLKTQIQVSEIDIYRQNTAYFFTKNASLPKIEYVESAAQISKIVSQFENRLFMKYRAKSDSELPPLIAYRLLVLSFIVLKCRTMSAIGRCRFLFLENYKRVTAYIYDDFKCRMVSKSLQCVMRSFSLMNLQAANASSLKYPENPLLTCNSTAGHCTESAVIENVLDVYEYAYRGEHQVALERAHEIAMDNKDSIVGRRHGDIAKCLLDFDTAFFAFDDDPLTAHHSVDNLAKLLDTVYQVCPAEAVFRDCAFHILRNILPERLIRRLYYMIDTCTAMGLFPVHRIRCHLMIAQFAVYHRDFTDAKIQLMHALKIATPSSVAFVMMIRRRLAMVAYFTKDYESCEKYLLLLKVDLGLHRMPVLEEALLNLTQFFVRFRLLNRLPAKFADPMVLLTYLNRAHRLLSNYQTAEKIVLALRMSFVLYLRKMKRQSMPGYKELNDSVKNDIVRVYKNKKSRKLAFSNASIKLLSKNFYRFICTF